MSQPIEACHVALGARIRIIREALGLSQDDLAKRVGMTRPSVTNVEVGRRRLLLQTVEAFARGLGTTPKTFDEGSLVVKQSVWRAGAIWLVREGNYAVVKVEAERGKWVDLIRENLSGWPEIEFSHIIEPSGTDAAIEKATHP